MSKHILFKAVFAASLMVPVSTWAQALFQLPGAYQELPNGGAPVAATLPAAEPTIPVTPQPLRKFDKSVFGASLFRGRFAQQSFRGFNPDYIVGPGDLVDLQLWGAFDLVLRLVVDSQGNIFVPKVGPVQVSNVRNGRLNNVVRQRIKQVFRENVGVYAALASAEPVKVFVSGEVNEPGLYGAYASDSLLHFLDRAGGINTDTGSFLDIEIKRNNNVQMKINLYDFLLSGDLPLYQFQDGDTIVVGGRNSIARVSGLVNRPLQFEFSRQIRLAQLLEWAGVDERATHVQVIRNQTLQREAEYLPLAADLASTMIVSGDQVSVYADRQVGSIIAEVDGEYEGLSQFVLPYDSTLEQLISKITPTSRSNMDGLQLYRKSIATRQRQVLDEMLQKLEQAALTARSGTREEAQLRTQEAELILKFVERARDIEPKGRLVMYQGFDPSKISLEDRDLVKIPRNTNTVAVQGEVFFPSSLVWQEGKSVEHYIEQAGGVTQSGNKDRIFLVRPSGEMVNADGGWFSRAKVQPGDEIMVLPQIDSKKFQFSKDLVQIIYQLALSAGVVLRL